MQYLTKCIFSTQFELHNDQCESEIISLELIANIVNKSPDNIRLKGTWPCPSTLTILFCASLLIL